MPGPRAAWVMPTALLNYFCTHMPPCRLLHLQPDAVQHAHGHRHAAHGRHHRRCGGRVANCKLVLRAISAEGAGSCSGCCSRQALLRRLRPLLTCAAAALHHLCALAVAEVAVFMLPFNPINYLPGFYFGGLTAWIGQDILKASIRQDAITHVPSAGLLGMRCSAWLLWSSGQPTVHP